MKATSADGYSFVFTWLEQSYQCTDVKGKYRICKCDSVCSYLLKGNKGEANVPPIELLEIALMNKIPGYTTCKIETADTQLIVRFTVGPSSYELVFDKEAMDLHEMIGKLVKQVEVLTLENTELKAKHPRFHVGETSPDTWETYSNGVHLRVDLTQFKLTQPPSVFTSIHGGQCHWTTTGATSIYNITATGFDIYVQPGTVENAKSWGWRIQYLVFPKE